MRWLPVCRPRGRWVAVATTVALAACSNAGTSRPVTTVTPPRATGCEIIAPPAKTPSSVWIAVTDHISLADTTIVRSRADRIVAPLLLQSRQGQPCFSDGREVRRVDGLYRVATVTDTLVSLIPARADDAPPVRISQVLPRRGRDVLDAGVDALSTTDPATIAYAEQQSAFASVALPWDRAYVLLTAADSGPGSPADALTALRADLVNGAVRVEARPATDRSWWNDRSACPQSADPASGATAPVANVLPRVVYRRDDPVARALSERLVALDQAQSSTLHAAVPVVTARSLRAEGMDSSDFQAALVDGRSAAYVLAVRAEATDPCAEIAATFSAMPWLAPHGRIVPLIETRARLIVRRDRIGVAVDQAGAVHLLLGHSGTP